jgi:cell division protein FtsQ
MFPVADAGSVACLPEGVPVPVARGRSSVRHTLHANGGHADDRVAGQARLEPHFGDARDARARSPIATPPMAGTDDWQGHSVVVRSHPVPMAVAGRHAISGRHSQRRFSLPVAIAAAVGAASFAVLTGFGGATRKPGSVVVELDRVAELAGLGLNQVQLTGHHFTTDAAIFEQLELDRVRSLVSFNALAARERIEKLPWVETATITRLLPDTLAITITERKPFAVWQLGDRETLIDAGGRRLGGIRSGGAPELPRVAGVGAPDSSAELFAHLAQYPEITGRLVVAERVGQRRWTLRLSGELEVLLPSTLDARPFKALLQSVNGRRLLDSGSGQLDLRHTDRVVALPTQRPARLTLPNSRTKQSS